MNFYQKSGISSLKIFSTHPNSRLQGSWTCAQWGLLIFPLIPILGALGIFLGLIGTWKREYQPIRQRRVNWAIAFYGFWLILVSAFAFNPGESFLGFFGNFFPFLIFFAAYSTLIQTIAQLRQIAWILVSTSVPVVILGLGQLFLGWTIPDLVGWTLKAGGNPVGRIASVFMYANILAAYLQMVFILGVGLWIEALQAQKRPETASVKVLVFLSVAAIGDGIALILTSSRNAWAIAILALLAYALYQGWRFLIGLVVGFTASIFWAAFGASPGRDWLRNLIPDYFWARLNDQKFPNRPTAMLRVTQWNFALSLTEQRPWLGWGLRNFTPLYQQQMNVWLGHPHNLFLMLTAETGIPATIFFCSIVGWILAQGILFLSNSLAGDRLILFSYLLAFTGCIVFNFSDVTIFDLRMNTFSWLLLAAICGVSTQQKN